MMLKKRARMENAQREEEERMTVRKVWDAPGQLVVGLLGLFMFVSAVLSYPIACEVANSIYDRDAYGGRTAGTPLFEYGRGIHPGTKGGVGLFVALGVTGILTGAMTHLALLGRLGSLAQAWRYYSGDPAGGPPPEAARVTACVGGIACLSLPSVYCWQAPGCCPYDLAVALACVLVPVGVCVWFVLLGAAAGVCAVEARR